MDIFAQIQSAAHDGAFGNGGLPEPSLANLRAGNYKKGRVKLHGLPIAIETPQGTRRTGKSDGKPWSVICMAHYGYIEKTKGADGDAIDVFIGPWPESERVVVINRESSPGTFDEHKLLLGFPTYDAAISAYSNSYEKGQAGIGSTVVCTIDQLKWWLAYGNHTVPLELKHLPFDGDNMTDVNWDQQGNPIETTVPQLLYAMQREDAGTHALLDAVTANDILEDSDGEVVLDALVLPLNQLERKLNQMQIIMRGAGDKVKPIGMQITDPFKQRGTTNVAAIFEMSDGQTVSVYFHNPDTTPNKLTPDDEMVSWKWLLNKRDITIVVAKERGKDMNPREVARRVMKLVDANSERFKNANAKKAERMAAIEADKSEVEQKEKLLGELKAEIADLEVKVQAKRDRKPATLEGGETGTTATQDNQPAVVQGGVDISTASGYAAVMADSELKSSLRNELTDMFRKRQLQLARALMALGWERAPGGLLVKGNAAALISMKTEMTGLVGEWVYGMSVGVYDGKELKNVIEDDLSKAPEQIAADIDNAAETEEHKSDAILRLLTERHGWRKDAYGAVLRDFGGGEVSNFNSRGIRTFTADFDDRARYVQLNYGGDVVLDMDTRELTAEEAAAEFNQRTEKYAKPVAEQDDETDAAIRMKLQEIQSLKSELDDAGISYPSTEQFMADIESGNRVGMKLASVQHRLNGFRSDLEGVNSGAIQGRKIVGSGYKNSKKAAIEWLTGEIAKGEKWQNTDYGYSVNASNYVSTLKKIKRSGADDSYKSDEQLAAKAKEEAELREEGLRRDQELDAKVEKYSKLEEGSMDDMRSPIELSYVIQNSSKNALVRVVEAGSNADRYAALNDLVRNNLATQQDVAFRDRVDVNSALGRGVDFGYFSVSPRKGYRVIKLAIDVAEQGAPQQNPATSYLNDVIAGTVDLSSPDVADKLTELYEANNGNSEFDALFEKAAEAYQAHVLAAAKAAMG